MGTRDTPTSRVRTVHFGKPSHFFALQYRIGILRINQCFGIDSGSNPEIPFGEFTLYSFLLKAIVLLLSVKLADPRTR